MYHVNGSSFILFIFLDLAQFLAHRCGSVNVCFWMNMYVMEAMWWCGRSYWETWVLVMAFLLILSMILDK